MNNYETLRKIHSQSKNRTLYSPWSVFRPKNVIRRLIDLSIEKRGLYMRFDHKSKNRTLYLAKIKCPFCPGLLGVFDCILGSRSSHIPLQ